MYPLSPFILQNLKIIHRADSELWPICPEQSFLIQTSIITFIYFLALLVMQNLQKILTVDPKL